MPTSLPLSSAAEKQVNARVCDDDDVDDVDVDDDDDDADDDDEEVDTKFSQRRALPSVVDAARRDPDDNARWRTNRPLRRFWPPLPSFGWYAAAGLDPQHSIFSSSSSKKLIISTTCEEKK